MSAFPYPLPKLESRFLPPPGWREGTFTNTEGRTVRFGIVMPANARGIVVGIEGLSEFAEKYFETAHDMIARGFGFCIMDWQGQGRSHRHLEEREKRHLESFEDDLQDFHQFITDHVIKTAAGKPLVMLAHSMGGHLGLLYLAAHPRTFSCAAFSAPMVGINAIRNMPRFVVAGITALAVRFNPSAYVPGGRAWYPDKDFVHSATFLSSDPARNKLQNTWLEHDPELRVGDVTWTWLADAALSCHRLQTAQIMKDITVPCLFGIGQNDRIIDNNAIKALAVDAPNARIIELEGSLHEILMERDQIRRRFLEQFDALIKESFHAA